MPEGDRAGLFPGLLEDARVDGANWDALKLIVVDLLRAGDPLPPAVAAWVAGVLDGTRPRPVLRRPGPDPEPTENRNSAAVSAVLNAPEQGLLADHPRHVPARHDCDRTPAGSRGRRAVRL